MRAQVLTVCPPNARIDKYLGECKCKPGYYIESTGRLNYLNQSQEADLFNLPLSSLECRLCHFGYYCEGGEADNCANVDCAQPTSPAPQFLRANPYALGRMLRCDTHTTTLARGRATRDECFCEPGRRFVFYDAQNTSRA